MTGNHCNYYSFGVLLMADETGKREVPSDVLVRLAQFYRTSVDYLVELTDEEKSYPRKR